ncbi:MAG: hypothetical protein J6Z04_08280 [Clostridia bacterium]|nr:hypothetical protein [Clostridia bacterium]
MKRLPLIIPLLLLCAVLLASCGGKKKGEADPTALVTTAAAAQTDDAPAETRENAKEAVDPAQTGGGEEIPGGDGDPADPYTKNY